MIVPDVNTLVALFRDDHEFHDRARRWWVGLPAEETFAVPDLVWVGLIRVATNARVFVRPSDFGETWAYATALRSDDRYRDVGSRGWEALGRLGSDARARGNLVTDAYIAAVAVSLGASVVTFDRDFRKFDGVRIVEPA